MVKVPTDEIETYLLDKFQLVTTYEHENKHNCQFWLPEEHINIAGEISEDLTTLLGKDFTLMSIWKYPWQASFVSKDVGKDGFAIIATMIVRKVAYRPDIGSLEDDPRPKTKKARRSFVGTPAPTVPEMFNRMLRNQSNASQPSQASNSTTQEAPHHSTHVPDTFDTHVPDTFDESEWSFVLPIDLTGNSQ